MQAPTSTPLRSAIQVLIAGIMLVGAANLTACGPSRPPGTDSSAAAGAAVSAPAGPEASLPQLQAMPAPKGLQWDMSEGVTVVTASDSAKADSQYAIQLTPTAIAGMHRIGVKGNFGGGARTYHITLWVKPIGPVDAFIEARGRTMISGNLPQDYGRAFFDLDKVAVAHNKIDSDTTRFKQTSIRSDGDWKKISADMVTHDGWLYFSVGMVSQNTHVFTGAPGMGLIVGGITVTPGA